MNVWLPVCQAEIPGQSQLQDSGLKLLGLGPIPGTVALTNRPRQCVKPEALIQDDKDGGGTGALAGRLVPPAPSAAKPTYCPCCHCNKCRPMSPAMIQCQSPLHCPGTKTRPRRSAPSDACATRRGMCEAPVGGPLSFAGKKPCDLYPKGPLLRHAVVCACPA